MTGRHLHVNPKLCIAANVPQKNTFSCKYKHLHKQQCALIKMLFLMVGLISCICMLVRGAVLTPWCSAVPLPSIHIPIKKYVHPTKRSLDIVLCSLTKEENEA